MKWAFVVFNCVIVVLLFWAGGFEFNERGPMLVIFILILLFVFGMTITYPGWDKNDVSV